MTLPNFVVVGAPKCGTSTLYSWLCAHPEVYGSPIKEPFFLLDRDTPLAGRRPTWHDTGVRGYRDFFSAAPPGARVVFEATTHYMHQETALQVLRDLPSRPRVAFLLREPATRMLSSFSYTRHNLGRLRSGLTFAQFAELSLGAPDRIAPFVRGARSAWVLAHDLWISQYATHIRRWVDALGAARVHVWLLEDLRRDPRQFMAGVARAIGIDPRFYDTFRPLPRNATRTVRSPRVHFAARRISSWLPGIAWRRLARLAYDLMQDGGTPSRGRDDELALVELRKHFLSYNRALARETGLDVSAWNEPRDTARRPRAAP